MTREETGARCRIPAELLREYERWGLCSGEGKTPGAWRYDQEDLDRLSLMTTLLDAGFTPEETERYLRLAMSGGETAGERLAMLRRRRDGMLDEIHRKQEQLDRLDHLRFTLSRAGGK